MTTRCWCGGTVIHRIPGDASGLGCGDNITHNYQYPGTEVSVPEEPQTGDRVTLLGRNWQGVAAVVFPMTSNEISLCAPVMPDENNTFWAMIISPDPESRSGQVLPNPPPAGSWARCPDPDCTFSTPHASSLLKHLQDHGPARDFLGTYQYLSLAQLAERIGVAGGSLSRYKLPVPDAVIGPVNSDGSIPRGTIRGWYPETADEWNANRPGRGARTDRKATVPIDRRIHPPASQHVDIDDGEVTILGGWTRKEFDQMLYGDSSSDGLAGWQWRLLHSLAGDRE